MKRHSPLILFQPFLFRGPAGRAIEMSMTWTAMRCCGVTADDRALALAPRFREHAVTELEIAMTLLDRLKQLLTGKAETFDAEGDTVQVAIEKSWLGATKAMEAYVGFRATKDQPLGSAMWYDDFMLGFRDGISRVYFSEGRPGAFPHPDIALAESRWRRSIIGGPEQSRVLTERIFENLGKYKDPRDRYAEGYASAMILETSKWGRAMTSSAEDIVRDFEQHYRSAHPNASTAAVRQGVWHALLMEYLVKPMREENRQAGA